MYYTNLNIESIKDEEWRDVVDYEGIYEVSNKGRVKSIGRYVNSSSGNQRWVKERILKQYFGMELSVKLSVDNIAKTNSISVLVANAFLRDRKKGEEICQYDKNPENCALDNLIIMSFSASAKQSYIKGRLKGGIEKVSQDIRKRYEEENGVFKNGELTHIKCNKCSEVKPVNEFYHRKNYKRRECIDCVLKRDGRVKKVGDLRKRKKLAEKGRRICGSCKKEKDLNNDFSKSKNSFMGRRNVCQECDKAHRKLKKELNK